MIWPHCAHSCHLRRDTRYNAFATSPRRSALAQMIRNRLRAYSRSLDVNPIISIHLGHFLSSTCRMPLASPTPEGPKTVEVLKTSAAMHYNDANRRSSNRSARALSQSVNYLPRSWTARVGQSTSRRAGKKAKAPPKRGLAPSHRSAWGDTLHCIYDSEHVHTRSERSSQANAS